MRTKADLLRLLEKSRLEFDVFESGKCWMIVCPALAARIMGAGVGDENAFWVPPALSVRGWNQGGNAGGQRTWIAPEGGPSGFFFRADGSRWEVPLALDPGNYRPLPALPGWASYRTELEARSADGSSRHIALIRSMKLQEDPTTPGAGLAIRFQHELQNTGPSPIERSTGLWSLIQLPSDVPGTVFFACRGEGAALNPYFGDLPSQSMGGQGALAWIRIRSGARFKAGMSAADFAGTIGFVRRAREAEKRAVKGAAPLMLTAMKFEVDPEATYVDKPYSRPVGQMNGDAAQVYCDAGTGDLAFCEIESHAPAPFLAPGQSRAQNVVISIARARDQDLGIIMNDKLGLENLPSGALPD